MLTDKQERHEAQAFSALTVFVAAVVAHIVVNFRSGDGQQKTIPENPSVEIRTKHTAANAGPFKAFAFHTWLGL